MRRRPPQSALGTALRAQFARNVRHFRRKRGMTQRELAAAAGVGRTFVSQVERGHFSVTLETIGAISSALEVSPTLLIQVCDLPRPNGPLPAGDQDTRPAFKRVG